MGEVSDALPAHCAFGSDRSDAGMLDASSRCAGEKKADSICETKAEIAVGIVK